MFVVGPCSPPYGQLVFPSGVRVACPFRAQERAKSRNCFLLLALP